MGAGTQHPRLAPFRPPGLALGKTKRFPRLGLHQETWRSCCRPPGELPPGKSLLGEGTPGTAQAAPGPAGLTEACLCVLERIPWIFTWLLLAAAMSTHSPRRRASPGP